MNRSRNKESHLAKSFLFNQQVMCNHSERRLAYVVHLVDVLVDQTLLLGLLESVSSVHGVSVFGTCGPKKIHALGQKFPKKLRD